MKRLVHRAQHLGSWIELVMISEESEEAFVKADQIFKACFEECERIDLDYSRFRDDNQLAELNKKLGEWQVVDDELFGLIKFGIEMGGQTAGAYDMRSKKILENWGYDSSYSFKLKSTELDMGALEHLSGLELDEESTKVRLTAPLELGGHGKGYAVDQMKALLDGVEHYCINAGGDLYVKGMDFQKGAWQPWRIAFEHPMDPSKAIGVVEASELALASSSSNRRQWGNGKHHLVNVESGEAANEMMAVYTQAESAMVADAYSTALYVMGYEKARAFLNAEKCKELGLEAMLIAPDGDMFKTQNFKGELFLGN